MTLQIELISREYSGWSYQEIKTMTRRERKYWSDLIIWRAERYGR